MKKFTVVNFQLAPSGVVLIAAGALLIGALLAGAGYIVGSKRAAAPAPTQPLPAAPAPAPAAPTTATAAAPPAEAFALRVKTVASEAEVKALQGELKAKEIESVVVPLPGEGDVVIYEVDIATRYASRREAADAAAAIADKKGVETVVVPAAPLPKPPG